MLNRVGSDFVKLTMLSMMVFTVGAGGCSSGKGLRVGTTGGATSSTAGATGATGGSAGATVGLTSTTGGTTGPAGAAGGGGMTGSTVGSASYAGTVGTTGGIAGGGGQTIYDSIAYICGGGASAGNTIGTSGGTIGSNGGSTSTSGGTNVQGVFVPTDSMTVARSGHTATLLPAGRVLIAGGSDDTSAELYDPATGTFTATGNMTAIREWHTATLLPNGKVLIAGGLVFNSAGLEESLASAEIYDPGAGTFTATGRMLVARVGHTATLLPIGTVLIAGGEDASSALSTESFASAEVYDPAAGTFTATGNMTAARTGHTATLLPNGKVLIAGGLDSNSDALASAELYDPSSGKFTATRKMSVAWSEPTATLLENGKVLIAGDYAGGNAELYDPGAGKFTATGSMTVLRTDYTATLLPSGNVLIVGGQVIEGAGTPGQMWVSLASAEQYDPAVGTFSPTGSMSISRGSHTATLLPNGQVLIAGGVNTCSGALASAELYNE
jgi:Galactose oxidase, central domain